jgi:SPP1 family predicted phage head-tail adaptor
VIRITDPGAFRQKLTYQEPTLAKDAVGQPIESWEDVAVVWAKISPLSARESWWAQQTHATTTHQITCRYDARIKPTGRLKLGDRLFAIGGVMNVDERRIFLILACTEAIPSES